MSRDYIAALVGLQQHSLISAAAGTHRLPVQYYSSLLLISCSSGFARLWPAVHGRALRDPRTADEAGPPITVTAIDHVSATVASDGRRSVETMMTTAGTSQNAG